ncbi:zinc finger protein 436-like [Teleopsis dalmanni]|uniref:zinc finger protein 436-like n=1 Tax=Teleopsis dalmanni TaxID=139649 RepID=UPI0018CEEAB4|nr:zinc finger protein 436-like [Teleopsis dalmanni]XP_037951557.1 zinc finger protein 436-like [Teleopsis dalmanni]XP_037951558.1 zinc finger protein 436-like [Teleopsis dalmanni]
MPYRKSLTGRVQRQRSRENMRLRRKRNSKQCFARQQTKPTVRENPIDIISDNQTTIKDDVSEKPTRLLFLIENENTNMITLENETIKQEPEVTDETSNKDDSTVQEFINDEIAETYTEQLLLKNETTALNAHKGIHMDDHPFACDFCDKKFPYLSTLKNHRRSHTGEKPFTCTECKQRFSVKESLNRHRRQHTGEKPFTCTKCNQSFSLKSSLNRHMKGHTGEKPYKCTECNQSFTAKQSLYHHMKRHTGEKPFSCIECNQSFARKQVLNHHMRRHTGEKPHVCNECGLSFFEATRLRYHSKIHLRPFACDQCDEKFKSIKQLQQHIRIHLSNRTGEEDIQEQKFKCKECNVTYVTEEELDSHYDMGVHKNTKKGQTEDCIVCNKKFGSIKTLNSHIIEVHKEQPLTFNNTKSALKLKKNRSNSSSTTMYESNGLNENANTNVTIAANDSTLTVKYADQQYIIDNVAKKETEELLLVNEVYTTLQNANIKTEPVDCAVDDVRSMEDNIILHKFIKNEVPETSTDQFLIKNEFYTDITIENESIKMENHS